jgi:hypothetical protein
MRALHHLRRFINAKNNEEERAEIREYLIENAQDLAESFGVPQQLFVETVAKIEDDTELAIRVLDGIRRATSGDRRQRYEAQSKSAQQSAEILGAVSRWRPSGCEIDLQSVLASCLTRRQDLLVFVSDTFAVAVRMAPLFDLAKLQRPDLTGWVDAKGLHVRWATGGLNFLPASDPQASRIIVPLAGRARLAA